jgi:DNA-binding IclR family transcriptional regulator
VPAKPNQSVVKAITLLRAAADGHATTVSALARAAQLPRPTALRLIQTLERERFLVRVPGGDRVLIGPELVRLARSTDMGLVLRELASPALGELSRVVGETVTLSVVAADGDLDVVHQVDGPQHLLPRSWVGQRFPLHASSSGKVLLAGKEQEEVERLVRQPLEKLTPRTITTMRRLVRELAEVRANGYAVTVDELEVGLAGVSIAIRGGAGELAGTINVSGLAQRLDEQARRQASRHMHRTAAEIEGALHRSTDGSTRSPRD